MEKDKEELFSHIMSSLNTKLDSYKVGSMIYDDLKGYYFKCTDNFNNLTINEFLTLYKISLMNDMNIITEEEAVLLEKLFNSKLQINRKIGDIAYRRLYQEETMSNAQINSLYQKVVEIDQLLSRYHLIMNQEEYQEMLMNGIINEDFSNIPTDEEIKALVKTL